MRLFQLITFGRPYLAYFRARMPSSKAANYSEGLAALLNDRYSTSHILLPVLEGAETARFVVADDESLQRTWAHERGIAQNTSLESIVLSQIEEHRSDVLYNLTPVLFDSKFLRRLPGCVRKTVCWRAAPSGGADYTGFDLRLSNFKLALDEWQRQGYRAAWFEPSHDPVASQYAEGQRRDIDIAFVGSYGRLHANRNILLQRIAEMASRYQVRFHFAMGRSARLVNSIPFARYLFPQMALTRALRTVSQEAVYGRAMYELFGSTKIVINAAIDMAERFRGNMRCWEAMGCGSVMLSDEGVYPQGMNPGLDFEIYRDADDAILKIERILADYDTWRPMASRAVATMETTYSKQKQWAAFVKLVGQI